MSTLTQASEIDRIDYPSDATLQKENPISKNSKWFKESKKNLDFSYHSLDPSEHLGFTRPLMDGVGRFDTRSDKSLNEVLRDHPSAMERERAFWELMNRQPDGAADVADEFLDTEKEPCLRWGALWAAQKFLGDQFINLALPRLKDEHIEVRDWARVLLSEVTGVDVRLPDGPRNAARVDDNPFDQTLPLVIAGYARVYLPTGQAVQATLSPIWFESLLGRVMACTCEDTFEKELVIEKCISNYHPDGTDHFEIYKFRGFSQWVTSNLCYHHYTSQACHTYYPSGKVEDLSKPALDDVFVNLERQAGTVSKKFEIDRVRSLVESVRGRYMGYAFTDIERALNNGMQIGPGEVQLSNLAHPIAGPLTNTLIYGTFRGKISDWDGDGLLDANTIRCHGTRDGKLDYHADGTNAFDPYDPFKLC